jgi:hypothetical protein
MESKSRKALAERLEKAWVSRREQLGQLRWRMMGLLGVVRVRRRHLHDLLEGGGALYRIALGANRGYAQTGGNRFNSSEIRVFRDV